MEVKLAHYVYACVERLIDNYEFFDMSERLEIELTMSQSIMANEKLAQQFVDKCLDNGVIENDYFAEEV